ncbi:MAG: hypothetical protein OZ924_17780 [Burkholderiaceae bacterium]|nr:hypothetical protein [Burkholderiaceae bacterium]
MTRIEALRLLFRSRAHRRRAAEKFLRWLGYSKTHAVDLARRIP